LGICNQKAMARGAPAIVFGVEHVREGGDMRQVADGLGGRPYKGAEKPRMAA
jgi:hypothetical protein